MSKLWRETAERAIQYNQQIRDRRVYPDASAIDQLAQFDEPFPTDSTPDTEVIAMLDDLGSPATVAVTGGRYFGFVQGGSLPVTVASNWLTTTWDQNTALTVMSPIATKLDEIAVRWVIEALGLPEECNGGIVTGATMANFTALATARHHLLARAGWDVEADGLFGAPEIKVIVGAEVHSSMQQALMMVGFGKNRLITIPTDEQGRMLASELPELDEMTLVCVQAGNVNTGAFDPIDQICDQANQAGAWVHIDGAFGIWANATTRYTHLTQGIEKADSWATDGHKWLNVPYDSGVVITKHPDSMRAAMMVDAPYLAQNEARQPAHYTPELSRRARGIDIWAALKSLGKKGLSDLIEGCCAHASFLADGLREAGFTVHHDVVINQVFVSFGDPEKTDRVIAQAQQDGVMWAGRSVWQGQVGMRLSVSSWATTHKDIEQTLQAIIDAEEKVRA